MKTGRDGNATYRLLSAQGPTESPKVRYFVGITENKKQTRKQDRIFLEYPDLFKINRMM